MADTIPDIRMSRTAYIDVYAATKIPKGTQLLIQNKSTTGVYIQIRPTAPLPTSTDGYLLMANETCEVSSSTISGVWIIGAGALSVQILE